MEESAEPAKAVSESVKKSAPNYWMIATIVLAIALVGTIVFLKMPQANPTGAVTAAGGNAINSGTDSKELAQKTLDYLKANSEQFFGAGSEVKLKESTVENGLNKFAFEIIKDGQTQAISIYLINNKIVVSQTIDGALDITRPLPKQETAQAGPETQIQKSDKPTLQLFVMSYCPYGNQAEAEIIPALKLLGNSVDFKLRYIVSKQGNDYTSLHGAEELTQNVRELCIQKYTPEKFLDYISAVNTACNLQNISTCWKTEASKTGLDIAKIEQCANTEKNALLDAEIAASEKYSVSGSPTLIINEGLYNGGRSPENYKQAICNAFNTQPSDCNKTLGSTETTASGGCAT